MGRMVNGGARLLSNVGLKNHGNTWYASPSLSLSSSNSFSLFSTPFPTELSLSLTHLFSLFPILSLFRIKKKVRYFSILRIKKVRISLVLSRFAFSTRAGQTSLFPLPCSSRESSRLDLFFSLLLHPSNRAGWPG